MGWNRKRQITKSLDEIDRLVEMISKMTQEYHIISKQLIKQIRDCETLRTKIINTIEEAEHRGLNKRTANYLEDKLNRPYAFSLIDL